MDRFEGHTQYSFSRVKFIYIPVWIDLKGVTEFLKTRIKNLYIPVWIDLKFAYARKKNNE